MESQESNGCTSKAHKNLFGGKSIFQRDIFFLGLQIEFSEFYKTLLGGKEALIMQIRILGNF
ncbi:hypothetical protein CH373_07830 [Leptospira perolatii]|uniref:Uncharacterized protein n=1 Tax=Leptospira perolatii TaxID=2023191 RepID=A0A2M9ZN37_9LEPT|nr:hypothetical protein CH360_13885 [Leptospira perolatii]PJZ73424.1 hypothetical protein CH373_07830 [Leptospira perolatii]